MTSFNLYHLLTGSKSKKVTLRVKTSTYEFFGEHSSVQGWKNKRENSVTWTQGPCGAEAAGVLLCCSCAASTLQEAVHLHPTPPQEHRGSRCHHCCRCCWSRSLQVLCCELCCWNHCLGKNPGAYMCLLAAPSIQKCCHKQEKTVSFPLHFP